MTETGILLELGLIVTGAAILALLMRVAHLPAIVGYILAGLLLGPGMGMLEVGGTLDVIAEVGIVLLLFLVGLELSLEKIRDVGRVAILAGVAQITLTGLAVAALSFAFGRSPGETGSGAQAVHGTLPVRSYENIRTSASPGRSRPRRKSRGRGGAGSRDPALCASVTRPVTVCARLRSHLRSARPRR